MSAGLSAAPNPLILRAIFVCQGGPASAKRPSLRDFTGSPAKDAKRQDAVRPKAEKKKS
jgi:hypothetical protein